MTGEQIDYEWLSYTGYRSTMSGCHSWNMVGGQKDYEWLSGQADYERCSGWKNGRFVVAWVDKWTMSGCLGGQIDYEWLSGWTNYEWLS